MPELTCFRLLDAESPAGPLADAVRQVNAGKGGPAVFTLDPVSFEQVPNAPFAYWVEEKVRQLFRQLPNFESEHRTARQGLATSDDFRFVRCWWEAPIGLTCAAKRRWYPFAKGGAYSPYYADLHLVIDWQHEGRILGMLGNHTPSKQYYFLPGLTWPLRLHRMCTSVLPAGTIISARGYGIYSSRDNLALLLAITNSYYFDYLFKVMLGRDAYPEFIVGILAEMPFPTINDEDQKYLIEAAIAAVQLQRARCVLSEVSPCFTRPSLGPIGNEYFEKFGTDKSENPEFISHQLDEISTKIDDKVRNIYNLSSVEFENYESVRKLALSRKYGASSLAPAEGLLASYAFGLALGRWDHISATGETLPPSAEQIFDARPSVPPGLGNPKHALLYLVQDDNEDSSSLMIRIREVLLKLFGNDVSKIELELTGRLGVDSLSIYYKRDFFCTHLADYSAGQRMAPIYWPLSTKSGDFTLWVYYPKLDDQSLPKLIADVLSPKIRTLTQELENRRATPGGKVAELEALRQELEEMRTDFLDLVKRGYRPNQNDGVLITACPLAKYFRHAAFRKNLEVCWKELAQGDYDWANLAMAMWPERALEACEKDRTIAIAHGREDLCPAEPPKATRGRKKTSPSA